MADSREDQDLRRFYAHSFSGHIVTAMLVGIGVLLATGVLDWLFQPEMAPRIQESRIVLLVTCLFSLMAAWTVELTLRQHYRSQRSLERERDELEALQREHGEWAWLQEQLGDYQLRISGDQTVQELMQVTMHFLGPVRFEDETRGVIELALTEAATGSRLTLLEQVGERLGHALVVAEARHGSGLLEPVSAG